MTTSLSYNVSRLHHAILMNNVESVANLLSQNKKDAFYLVTTQRGDYDFPIGERLGPACALHLAAATGSTEIVKKLLSQGSGVVNNQSGHNQATALHYAAQVGFYNTMELLIAKGASVNVQDDGGQTPLFWAAKFGHAAAVEFLIANKSNPNHVDKEQNSALHLAAQHNRRDVGLILIRRGASGDAQNKKGMTALQLVTVAGWVDGIHLLSKNGADVNKRDNAGRTALHHAVLNFDQTGPYVIKVLLVKHADRGLVDFKGKSAYDYAELDTIKNIFFQKDTQPEDLDDMPEDDVTEDCKQEADKEEQKMSAKFDKHQIMISELEKRISSLEGEKKSNPTDNNQNSIFQTLQRSKTEALMELSKRIEQLEMRKENHREIKEEKVNDLHLGEQTKETTNFCEDDESLYK